MIIDIIHYTDEQYAALTEEQLLEIKSAQLKKDTLIRKLEKDKALFRQKLVENGIYLSNAYFLECLRMDEECEAQITALRESLLFYLRFAVRSNSTSIYPIDYSLSMEERYHSVKQYYLDAYPDASECFNAFKKDNTAKTYLGEFYATLYDYFYMKLP